MSEFNKYQLFLFDEINFNIEKKRLAANLNFLKKNNISVRFLKKFPPCVLECPKPNLANKEELVLSENDILINNNLFFGKEFVKINKRFENSPFISQKCKECGYHSNFYCRGLFNEKFLKVKNEIIKCRGNEHYNALMTEYMYGILGYTSECNVNCIMCGKERKRYGIYIEPQLSIKEILHFLHYIPSGGVYTDMLQIRCIPGEPLLHKDIIKILEIEKSFSINGFSIITNGCLLNDKLLDIIARFNFNLYLSLHSIDNAVRKKIMGYKKDINLKKLIKNILERNIELSIPIVALKENILNGDLKKTILYLKKVGITPTIYLNYYNAHYPKKTIENLDYSDDFLIDYLKNNNLYAFVNLMSEDSKDKLSRFLKVFKNYLKKINKKDKILVLCPEKSYKYLKKSLKGRRNIRIEEVKTKFGFNVSLSCSLIIDDFLDVISKINYKYDHTIVPKGSFDILMNDLTNKNINKLVQKVNAKVHLL